MICVFAYRRCYFNGSEIICQFIRVFTSFLATTVCNLIQRVNTNFLLFFEREGKRDMTNLNIVEIRKSEDLRKIFDAMQLRITVVCVTSSKHGGRSIIEEQFHPSRLFKYNMWMNIQNRFS
jgi:hypothetical protein